MSVLKLMSMYDTASEAFGAITAYSAQGQATRDVEEIVNDGSSIVSKYPQHFALYHLADFDTSTGAITPLSPVKQICLASDYLIKQICLASDYLKE